MSHHIYTPILPGKIVELNERVFLIDKCHYDSDGELVAMTAKCLTPKDGDSTAWFTLEVNDPMAIQAHTLQ